MGLNAMQWHEKDHLNVDGMNRIAQSMKRWDEHCRKIAKTHTPKLVQCVIQREWVEHWKNRSLRSWPKMSVRKVVCVLTHKRS